MLHGRTPLEEVTGKTPDISEYLDFGFYDYVWFRENAGLRKVVGMVACCFTPSWQPDVILFAQVKL